MLFSLFPPHAGMRQYWRDFDSLERWARSLPHREWWQQFLRDRGGTGFWHETYFRGGQIESVYIDMPQTAGHGTDLLSQPCVSRITVPAGVPVHRLVERRDGHVRLEEDDFR